MNIYYLNLSTIKICQDRDENFSSWEEMADWFSYSCHLCYLTIRDAERAIETWIQSQHSSTYDIRIVWLREMCFVYTYGKLRRIYWYG